ncbi:MAG: hypothetical protein CMN85_04700 [Spongiibacteraceae bacterium]|nr:hypothetical protein [Spongiibacteraceae bacterium]
MSIQNLYNWFINMKLLKYFAGSLIISLGIMMVLAILVRSLQIELPTDTARYFLLIWVSLAIVISPFAKKIIRV